VMDELFIQLMNVA